ncbi:MAG TPA: transketolase family protein [Bacteroidetes bacterium]|nr:transketolase family protein [Bacteroidota bacterium]
MSQQNCRKVYGETLLDLGGKDSRIVVLEADLSKSTMTTLFQEAFPERFFEMGIAEQNMVSTAAGLAISGKIPFVNSFAVFSTGRVYDQIRQSVCLGKVNVKIIGSSCGLSDFGDGATHQSIEDVGLMRLIPNMTVLAPVDGNETRRAVEAAVDYNGPVYIRINRNDMPDITSVDDVFTIGEPGMVRDGSDIVVFANGYMVWKALLAAASLEKQGVSVRVVNVSSLKPVNGQSIREMARGMKGIVTIEEHTLVNGLGSIVLDLFRGNPLRIETLGIPDVFGQSAPGYEELLRHYGLDESAVIRSVEKILS